MRGTMFPTPYRTMSRRDLRRARRRRRHYRRRRAAAAFVFAVAAGAGLAGGLVAAWDEDGSSPPPTLAASTPEAPSADADPKGTAGIAAQGEAEVGPTSYEGDGKLEVVPGSSEVSGPGEVSTFVVEVERGLDVDPEQFAVEVERTLFDERSWGADGALAFQRVDSGDPTFRVALTSPEKTDELCYAYDTNGRYSCHQDGRAVLNVMRWFEGARAYRSDLQGYRRYLVNHEVGHAIGHSAHSFCPAEGEPAPVMMQQTKGVAPCEPNPWPTEAEGGGGP